MKIYAKQVAPEYQESPLLLSDEFPDNIAVFGNCGFNEHKPEYFQRVYEALENGELAEALEDIETEGYYSTWYESPEQAIKELLPAKNKEYSTEDIRSLEKLIPEYLNASRQNSILCKVLFIVTGKEWDYRQINGYCQSDWNYFFYTIDEWDKEAISAFEVEYFNTGTEWIIDDGEFDPENDSPEDISGFSMYCTSWNDEGIKQEIAEASGGKIEDIILYAFDGYTQTAKYKEVAQ